MKKVLIIAEAGVNHNGSIEVAIETIKAAKRAGADCIKLQTYRADTITIDSKKNVWICHYGGACISVYNSRGKKIHKIELPAKNITNCTFGGLSNNEIYISTALKGMTKNEIKK